MFDFRISKHPHFDEACRAFALRHNMAKLAERAGMNVQTLRNKLNPDQPHQLTAPDIWLLTDLTEDSALVDGFPGADPLPTVRAAKRSRARKDAGICSKSYGRNRPRGCRRCFRRSAHNGRAPPDC